jgi:hypothetical protein
MVWYDMALHGMVWYALPCISFPCYGMVWYTNEGKASEGIPSLSMPCHALHFLAFALTKLPFHAFPFLERYAMVWYGRVWYDMLYLTFPWPCMVWNGMPFLGLHWHGMVWYGNMPFLPLDFHDIMKCKMAHDSLVITQVVYHAKSIHDHNKWTTTRITTHCHHKKNFG